MIEKELHERLEELERRLLRIEAALGLSDEPSAVPAAPSAPSATADSPGDASAAPVSVAARSPQPDAETPLAVEVPGTPEAPWEPAPVDTVLSTGETPSPRTVPPWAEPVPAREAVAEFDRPALSLEVLIGERWMGWAGAIVIVVATALFVKLGYDLGWWGRLSPLAKCLLCASLGVALLIAGEITLRRIGRIAAVSLYGAGLGTLYMTAYATFRFFHLLTQTGAFTLMAGVVALGIALTLRGRLLAIGVLSLLGGYFTPALLREHATFVAALPLYLSGLLIVTLALSAKLPATFQPLRPLGLLLHGAVATLWLWQEGREHWLLAMVFLTVWWVVVGAEVLLDTFRAQAARSNPVIELLVTTWYATVGCGVLAAAQPGARDWLGVFLAGVAVVSAWAALIIGPGLAGLRAAPRRPLELMTAALWLQVGVLIATALGLQFRDPGETHEQSISWLVMAVACIELGRRLPSRGAEVFGLLVGLPALARIWLLDWHNPLLITTLWERGSVTITGWVLLALGGAAATIFAGRRLRTGGQEGWKRLCAALTLVGTLQWAVAWVVCADGTPVTAAWCVAVLALLLTAHWRSSHGHEIAAMLLLTAAALKWIVADALLPRFFTTWDAAAHMPLLNWPMLGAALVTVSFGVAWYTGLRVAAKRVGTANEGNGTATARGTAEGYLVLGVLFLLMALSFQLEHLISRIELSFATDTLTAWPGLQVRMLWWTLLWVLAGLALLACAHRWGLELLWHIGWVLVALGAGIWLTADTLFWRVQDGVPRFAAVALTQSGIGLATAAAVAVAAWLTRRAEAARPTWFSPGLSLASFGWLLAILIVLWLGSLELDRYFSPEAGRVRNPAMVRQMALSIFWGAYAIGLVALGFALRSASTRYAGLALLAITLAKVLLVDLAHVKYIYRVLSLLIIGLICTVTSIAYARLAARLPDESAAPARAAGQRRDRP